MDKELQEKVIKIGESVGYSCTYPDVARNKILQLTSGVNSLRDKLSFILDMFMYCSFEIPIKVYELTQVEEENYDADDVCLIWTTFTAISNGVIRKLNENKNK